MTLVLAIAMTAVAATALFLALVQSSKFDSERHAWADERRELITRIQRPDHLPVSPRPEFMVPERELDEWNQVGRVVIDPGYGLDGN